MRKRGSWRASAAVAVGLAVAAGLAGALPASAATLSTPVVYAPPAVTGVSPAAGVPAGGTTVTVTGSGFRAITKVAFGAVAGTKVQVVSTGKLTVVAPKGAVGTVDVRVYGSYGTSAVTAKDKFRYMAAPSVPFTETVAATGLGVLASWAPAPAADLVQAFAVTATPASGSPSSCPARTVTTPAADTQALVGALCAGVVYTVTVKARNAAAYSAASPASAPVVPLAAQVPGVPLVTSVLARDKSLAVSWAAPSDTGGSALTGYLVSAAAGSRTVTVQAAAAARSATITGLADGTAYTVSVTAVNAVGRSAAATGSGTPRAAHAPSAPVGLTVVPDGKGHLVASWAAPGDDGGSAVTGYTLSYRQATWNASAGTWAPVPGAAVHSITAGAAATTATATSFETARAFYLFSITATNAAGTSAAAAQAAAVTPALTVSSKTVVLSAATVAALASATDAMLTWKDPAPAQASTLAAGQTVVAAAGGRLPQGTLRTVVGTSDKNGTLTVLTQQGTLAGAFTSMGVDAAVNPVTGAAPSSVVRPAAQAAPRFVPGIAGVRVLAQPAASGSFGWTSTLSVDVKSGPVSVQGETSLTTAIDVSLSARTGFAGIPDGVSVSATAKVTHADDFTVTAQGKASLYLGEIEGAPVTLLVGPVPVEITPKVPVFLTVSGSGAVGVEVSGTVGGGLNWSSADETALSARNLSSAPRVSGHAVPGWSVTGEVDLGLQAQPQADLYDAAGPNVEADIDAAAQVNFTPAPGEHFLTIGPKLELKAGLDLDLLGKHASLEATIGTFAFGAFVINSPPAASYTIRPASPSVAPGGTLTLTATRSDGAAKAVKWSLLGATKADSITSGGVLHVGSPAGRRLVVEVSDGTGAAGVTTVTVGTPFDAPSAVTATQRSSDTASITWKAPAHTGGSAITGYAITTAPSTGTHKVSPTATSMTLSGLVQGTYVVTVYAVNKSGWTSAPGTAQLTVAGSAPAIGSLSWQPPAVIDKAQDSGALSCATMSFCVETGSQSGSVTVFNGTSWTDAGPVVNDGWILGVSCPSTSFCLAGGMDLSPSGAGSPQGDVITYNGTSWSKPTDLPGTYYPEALSCSSATWCVMAAESTQNQTELLTFDGTQWSPAAAPADDVQSLSCVSATFCVAAGQDGELQYFNGTAWSAVFTANPDPADDKSVSCASATYCLAVALWDQTAWAWDGSSWQAVPSTSAPTGGFSEVSCAAGACDAIANTDGNSGVYEYDGAGNWTAVPAASYAAQSISCPAAGQCMMIGQVPDPATPYALYGGAFTLTGQSWTDAAPDRGTVSALSCPSPQFCAAADNGFNWPDNYGGPWGGNVMTYNGTSWSTPAFIDYDPSGNGGYTWSQGITGLSCASAAFCAAVDQYGYAFTYNGSGWTQGQHLTQGTIVSLTAVSCASPTLCAAVAQDGTAYTYNGSTWTYATSIDPYSWQAGGTKAIRGDTLLAVSCASATCVALDSYGYTFSFSDGTWTTGAQLSGSGWSAISCGAAARCVAVGGSSYAVLAAGAWSAPGDIDSATVNAVSCPSPSFCEAVDANGDALTFNGASWTTPRPALPGVPLTTISCAAAGACMAAGIDPATKESEAISGRST